MPTDTAIPSELHGGICVAVALPDTARAISAVKPLENQIDVVEIRLDAMQEVAVAQLCREINCPLLFTNRPAWEGGLWTGAEEERVGLLLEAVHHQPSFVDLEMRTAQSYREQLVNAIHGTKTHLILSHHDFEKTPDATALSTILQQQIDRGAEVGKIVTMAHSPLDVLRVLQLQCEAHNRRFPLIAFCMGEEGKLSRITTLLLGGFMTYAALDEQQATAPGQLSVQHLREAMAMLTGGEND